jgi:hypothetical protein
LRNNAFTNHLAFNYMFNNTALDVVIGLVLVYLLYSLLITILGELLATWFGLRARILRISIERMLNDGLDVKKARGKWEKFTSILARVFLKEPAVFKGSFAGLFYNYPSIKYLAKLEPDQAVIFGQTKPSYITPDNFAVTVINILCDHGTGATKYDQLVFSLENNTLSIEPETIKHLRNIYNLVGKDLDSYKSGLVAWYNETQDRTNGWYKRKISFILFWLGFFVAFAFNVDSIKIARILSKDKDARTQLVNMGIALSKDSARYKGFVNGNDTIPSRAVLDSGFARVSKDIGAANFILGLGWDFSEIKKDSTTIKDTSKFGDYLVYKKNVDVANSTVKAIRKDEALKREIIAALKVSIQCMAQDTLLKRQQLRYISDKKEQDAFKKKLNSEISDIGVYYLNIFDSQSAIKKDSDNIIPQIRILHSARDAINQKANEDYISLQSVEYKNKTVVITGTRHLTFWEKTGRFFCIGFFSWSFLGFIITGFALSLGAPFWFGLLNKLVALRGAGVKPKDDTDLLSDPAAKGNNANAGQSLAPIKQLNSNSIASAVQELKFRYGSYPGVLSIGQGFKWVTEKINGKDVEKKVSAVEIHLVASVLPTIQAEIKDGIYHGVAVNVMVNTIITAHLSGGDTIKNQSTGIGWGTLGCFAKNKNDTVKNYLMSCWHVLQHKGDTIKSGTNNVATVVDGTITPTMDIGFAEITVTGQFNNQLIGITQDCRTVTLNDAENETPVFFKGGSSKLQSDVVIYNHAPDDQKIYHPDTGTHYVMSDLFSITRYAPNTRTPTSPSKRGDSGSVVVDKEGHPIGVVVGGDGSFTYAVKLSNVFALNSPYHAYYIPFN